MRLGVFGDIHFQKKGLNRIIQTGEWIVEEFQRRGIDRVVCLGDLLNTREMVDVEAQAAAFSFLFQLTQHWHVDVVLGNHDMNLKHSRRISSLEALMMSSNVTLHRELSLYPVDDQYWLMMPYYEDQSVLVEKIQKLQQKNPEICEKTVGFGHLKINGAVQITRYNTKFAGAVGPDVFSGLKRVFTGHFHVHQMMDHRLMYVGSPQQFNFGDAGDHRGVVVYDAESDQAEFVINPYCDVFRFLKPDEIPQAEANPEHYRDTFVTLIYDDVITEADHEKNVERLEAIGVVAVKKESVVEKAIREHAIEIEAVQHASIADLVPVFVRSVLSEDSVLDEDALIRVGQTVVQKVNEQYQDVSDTGAIFHADPVELEIENFMGFEGVYRYPLKDMDGIWFSEGQNGAGKSTLAEALVWVYFGQQIRSVTKVDDVINHNVNHGCRVKLTFASGYAIERWRKYRGEVGELSGTGVRVQVNGQTDTSIDKADPKAQQGLIDDLIGINYATYTKSNVLGQNVSANFVSANEKDRRKIIEQMLGLERVDECLKMVRGWKSELTKQSEQQDEIQQIKANELSRQTELIAATEQQVLAVQADHEAKVNEASQTVYDGERELVQLRTQWDKHEASKAKVLEDKDVEIKQAEAVVDGLRAMLQLREEAIQCRNQATQRQTVANSLRQTMGLRNSALQQLHLTVTDAKTKRDQEVAALVELQKIDIEAARALLKRIKEIAEQAAGLIVQQVSVQAEVNKIEDMIRQVQTEQTDYQQAQQTASQDEKCPKCGRVLDKEAILNILQGLDQALSKHAQEVSGKRDGDNQLQQSIDTLRKQLEELQAGAIDEERMGQIQAEVAQKNTAIAQYNNVLAGEDAQRDTIEKSYLDDAIKAYPEDNGILTIEAMIQEVQAEINSLGQKAQHLDSQFDESGLNNAVEAVRHRRTEREGLDQHWDEQGKQVRDRVSTLASSLSTVQGQLEQMRANNPVDALRQAQERNRKLRDQISQELEQCKTTAIDIGRKQAYVKFWDSAFSGKGAFRSFLLGESVKDLNRVLEGYITSLDSELSVTFNDDLTIRESYGKRSGGQRKCTDLAVLFSMFEIVWQRSRHRSSIMVLDELFEALDTDHHRAVMDILTILAQRIQKIIVITHKDITGCTMAGSLYTELTADGSKVTIKRV